jgi:hypothetical protein
MKKRTIVLVGGAILVAAGALYYFLTRVTLADQIVIPYIAHQKPAVDPHLPSTNALADKLDEVQFDGLFNLTAGPSGVVYEDGLGEFRGIDQDNVVTIQLKAARKWHDSWRIIADDDKYVVTPATDHLFTAADFNFTLQRLQNLGSLSPDYILISQALPAMGFEGPDETGQIRLQFRGDRIWKEADIKEVLSFKILPDRSDMNALNYRVGTTSYMSLPPKDGVSSYRKSPGGVASITDVLLAPFIDNSTYSTELKNGKINVLLETPFGSLSPVLSDTSEFFFKSNISSTYFALFLNAQRLTREQRNEVRNLLNTEKIVERFFKVGTEQVRHIADYKGNRDNYYDYINRSVFPSSSYYVEEEIIAPPDSAPVLPNPAALPDTIRIKACMNYGFREEYAELIEILNDPAVSHGRLKILAVTNEEIKRGEYDALLVAVTGYRSNFLFDLYNIFLREPDLETYRINLQTGIDANGVPGVSATSFQADRNFFRLDSRNSEEGADINQLLQYVYAFMSTRQIGDKQEYARRIDALERDMCLGVWLFSLPSTAYFSTQFDQSSIDLYGVASQLSTIKRWSERKER